MNLTPKKDFIAKKQFADAHRDLVVSTQFREALHATLIDLVINSQATEDPIAAAAGYHRITGACQFVTRLLNVAEQTKTPPTTPPANLDHSIR